MSVNANRSGADIQGVVPVLSTPFRPDDEAVDYDALARLVDFTAALDVGAFCLPAYAGEFYKLSDAERLEVVKAAVGFSRGRLPVVAQSNHPSAKVAADLARRNADAGADVIAFAMPRMYPVSQGDLLDYCTTMCRAVNLPILVQDYNPGGPTVGAEFCARLLEACPNFRYIKLEEPLMGPKVVEIRRATAEKVGVFEGWGGQYMLELIPAGICGSIPGACNADVLALVWRRAKEGKTDEALDAFEMILPQITYALQTWELYLQLEKRLLVSRGVLPNATVRRPTWTIDPEVIAYGEMLNQRVLKALDKLGLPRNPAA